MPRLSAALVTFAVLFGMATQAQAGIVVSIDQAAQRLTVSVDGMQRYEWPVSTARWGYRTPNGSYKPQWLARKWFSTIYDNAPMPYSIFFNGGYAIHGTGDLKQLGSPASHGCIRLHPDNAAVLFDLVKANQKNTAIVVSGDRPAPAETRGRSESARARGRGSFEEVFGGDVARKRWDNRQ